MRTCFLAIAALAISTLFLTKAEAAEKNVIFIITDDESPTLGCYGDPVAVSPAVDAIAKDGLVFRNAFATTASCSASRSVVMSGLHNHRNGQFGHQHHFHKFASFHNVVSLALPRVMAGAGYRTAQIGKYHVAPETVYHFETYLKGNGRNAVEMAEKSVFAFRAPVDYDAKAVKKHLKPAAFGALRDLAARLRDLFAASLNGNGAVSGKGLCQS